MEAKMNIDELEKELDEQLGKYYNTVLISGPWGIGKTYYINEYSNNSHVYKVSLFGINSINDFKYIIAYSINPIEANLHKITTENDPSVIQLPFLTIPIPKIRKDFDSIIQTSLSDHKKHILIIDDLERKSGSISLKEIFGVIAELSEVNNLNIIIIDNDQYINELCDEDKKTYSEFKEKVIERTYHVDNYSDKAIFNICNKLSFNKGKEILKNKFINSNEKNLRILQKTVKYFNLIYHFCNINIIDKNITDKLLECVLVMMITINNKDFSSEKRIDAQIKYSPWNNSADRKNELIIVSYLYRLYLNNDFKEIDNIMQIFAAKEIVEPEKDLFYCSKEEIEERVFFFKNNVIENYNPNYNIILLLKDISTFKEYLEKYNSKIKLSNKEIKKSIEQYLNNTSYNQEELFNVINRLKSTIYITDKDLIKTARMKIIKKYLNDSINKIMTNGLKNCFIDIQQLYGVLTSTLLIEDYSLFDNELKIISNNNYFVPDFSKSIDENIWGCVHDIFEKIHFLPNTNILRKGFTEYMKEKIKKCIDEEKYRLEILIEEYSFDLK